jgi:hypothetical protein
MYFKLGFPNCFSIFNQALKRLNIFAQKATERDIFIPRSTSQLENETVKML